MTGNRVCFAYGSGMANVWLSYIRFLFGGPAFRAPIAVASVLVLSCCTSQREEDYSSFIRLPPGPECPDGEFLAGIQPHAFCMTEEMYDELFHSED